MNKTYKVSDLKRLISESSNEFKAVIGTGVEKENKSNNGKAYSDAKKRAKDFDGGLNKEVGEEKAKYEKQDANRTTLDYTPENATDEYRKRVHAQVKGYSSEQEMNNGLAKTGDFDDNEKIYQGIKKSGKEIHDDEKSMKQSGLQAREWPDKVFKKEEMYESKDGFDMRQMINKLNVLQEEFNGNLSDFYREADENGKFGEPGMVKSYDIGWNNSVENFEKEASEEGMTLQAYLKYWWDEVSGEGLPFSWQKLGSGYGYNGTEVLRIGNVRFKDIYDQLMIDEYEPDSEEQTLSENKNIKTVYFKKTQFLTEGHMISRIPDEFKKEGEQFVMKDKTGNEYLVEWRNKSAIIMKHSNKNGLNESLERMKNLYNYKTNDTKTTNNSRLNENDEMFISTLDNARKLK
jgi:hypothetical protein